MSRIEVNSVVKTNKNTVVYASAVSDDGKVRNYMNNLIHDDKKNIEESFEFYVPKHSDFKLTNSELSNLKDKINELGNNGGEAFNDMMLTSGNPFRLILIWLLNHVFPKMTEVADRNMQLYGIGLAQALKTFVERSELSLETLKTVCEQEQSAALLHLVSAALDTLTTVGCAIASIKNESNKGQHADGSLEKVEYSIRKQNIQLVDSILKTALGASVKTAAEYKSANNKLMSGSNTTKMEINTQELQAVLGQMDSLKNVAREAFDLVAKFLENYFNTATASNLQR